MALEGPAMASKTSLHIDPETIDQRLEAEKARVVALLRRLADRLEAAPVSRVSQGLTWISGGVEMLVKTVERALGRTH
jgi:hypothetical protein